MLLIKNGHIKTMAGEEFSNGCILVDDNGMILSVAAEIPAPAGAQVIDVAGRLVTPGCVEAHCHVGLHNASVRWEGADYNDKADPITPQMRAIDSIYPQDEYLDNAIQGGITTLCAGPGSANVVGGTFAAIKAHGSRVDDMLVKEPVAMKCAFGENPKNTYGQSSKKTPFTRMGTAAALRELLFKAQEYCRAKDAGENPKFDMKLEAMLPVMRREIPLKAHAHRADDILTSIRVAKEFGLRLTLDHCTEGHVISDSLAKEGFPAIVGPSFGGKSKIELQNKTFETAAKLNAAGVKICLTTDAPVTPIQYLPLCAGLAVAAGLPAEEAWLAITRNPAEVMGIADRVGSLEPGKDADIVIWTADPITTVGAESYMTLIDGKIVYQK